MSEGVPGASEKAVRWQPQTRGDTLGDLHDPDWYLGEDVHQTFAELRRSDPVYWQDMSGEPGYWAVLRHADVVHVSRHPEVFSSWLGGVLLEDPDPAVLEETRRMLLVMDPPRHSAYRQPLAPHFRARVIGRMEQQIRNRCRDVLAKAADHGDVDFCHDVAGPLASETIGEIMGLPHGDTPMIRRWAEIALGGQDQEVVDSYPGNAALEMVVYAIAWAAQRRAMPRQEDVTSLLLESTFEHGEPMSDVEFGSFFFQLVTAGNDTTRTLITSGTEQLIRHPDQMAALRDDVGLVPSAVEEMLRFCNPVHYMRRTATRCTELRGKQIRPAIRSRSITPPRIGTRQSSPMRRASISVGHRTRTSASASVRTFAWARTLPDYRLKYFSRSSCPAFPSSS